MSGSRFRFSASTRWTRRKGWWQLKVGDTVSPVIKRSTLCWDTNNQPIPSWLCIGPYQNQSLPASQLGIGQTTVYG